ncbi:dedicator of cytokinesis protein 1-like [Aricia agestis]|uniref:dedicator of cytokinesis protein 1-like n=1 Tax=Aricia agestis TaxID=91739 RepID=UPI001C20BB53|nr:dedicator of cytokinesis protein 1-like [Aricia agestis]
MSNFGRISVNAEMFEDACIVFFYRHRSFSNQNNMFKDRERFFAVSFIRLTEEKKKEKREFRKKRPVLADITRSLVVYKIDYNKRSNFTMEEHLSKVCQQLASDRRDLRPEAERGNRWVSTVLSSLPRNELIVSTKFTSTQLTQREEILNVFEWKPLHEHGQLQQALRRLQDVPGSELVKFLHDILDALFSILSQLGERNGFSDNSYSVLVLDCLLNVFSLLGEQKFSHFKPVLQTYIENEFRFPSAYEVLLPVMEWEIGFSEKFCEARQRLRKCLKHFESLMHIVVRSRLLHIKLEPVNKEPEIIPPLKNFLEAVISLMERTKAVNLVYQGEAVKSLPTALSHLVKLVRPEKLSCYIVCIFDRLPLNKIPCYRLKAYMYLVNGPLGHSAAARTTLIPHITRATLGLLEKETEMKLCIELLGEMINLFARKDIGPVEEDMCDFVRVTIKVLPPVATKMLERRRDNDYPKEEDTILRQLVCTIMDLLKNMNEEYYKDTLVLPSQFSGTTEADHLSNCFHLIMELVEQHLFPPHWADMLHTLQYVILHTLSLIILKLIQKLNKLKDSVDDIQVLLKKWFQTVSSMTISTTLQLENLRSSRRKRVLELFGDLRIKAATMMSETWNNLGTYKCGFIEDLVSPLLRVSFLHNDDVRNIIIPIIFDMMVILFEETSKSGKPNLELIKEVLINEVEKLVISGYGDEDWGKSFIKICGGMCVQVSRDFMQEGGILVAAVGRQLNFLIKYRSVPCHQRVHLISNLLNFYEEIGRPDMYLRYVHHLGDLHRQAGNWTEAGLTQHLHAKLLEWSEIPLPPSLRHPSREFTNNHLQLKMSLYEDAVELLAQGHQAKLAGSLLQELVPVHERRGHHSQLAILHERLSTVYRKSAEHPMITSPYFRVRYVGLGFPDYLRNPLGFVYRGNEFEQLQGFKERMLEEWPDAEVMLKLDEPGQDVTESDGQYLQINAVTAVMSEKWNHLLDCKADEDVIRYYEHNDVNTFQFDRPFYRGDDSLVCNVDENKLPCEFATRWLERTRITISGRFPGILRCFPVESSETFFVSPLEHAVEAMETSNKELKRAITDDKDKETMVKHLTLRLNGILDARVQGGLENYERTFFTDKYLACHPDHAPLLQRLRDRIAEQVPLLEQGLQIFEVHDSRNADLHAHLVQRYLTVYSPYGATYFDEKTQLSSNQMVVVRQRSSKSDSRSNNRLSDVSSGNESIVSKMTTVTKRNFNKMSWLRNTSTQTSSQRRRNKSKDSKRQSRLSIQYERDSMSAMSDIDDMLADADALMCRRCSLKTAALRTARRHSRERNLSSECLLDDV